MWGETVVRDLGLRGARRLLLTNILSYVINFYMERNYYLQVMVLGAIGRGVGDLILIRDDLSLKTSFKFRDGGIWIAINTLAGRGLVELTDSRPREARLTAQGEAELAELRRCLGVEGRLEVPVEHGAAAAGAVSPGLEPVVGEVER